VFSEELDLHLEETRAALTAPDVARLRQIGT